LALHCRTLEGIWTAGQDLAGNASRQHPIRCQVKILKWCLPALLGIDMPSSTQVDSSWPPADEREPHVLGTARVAHLLLQYSVPAIIATAAASIYNIVDRVFIGHGVGPLAISGLALTLPLMNLAASLGALVGAGASALVSIRLGQHDRQEADSILGNTVLLNVVLGTTYAALCLVFLDRILLAMGASQETLPYAREFMQVILLGNVFTHLYLGLNNVIRASGFPRKAMGITLLTVGVNLVLAPLFIFAFHWGIKGAAFATVSAQIAGLVCAFLHFTGKYCPIHFRPGCFVPRPRIIRDIFSIGMSSFITLSCASCVTAIVNVQLARYGGDYAIGAYGIVSALAGLFVMICTGLNMGMQPIAGYNFGAGRFDRVVKVFRLAACAATCITTVGFLLVEVFPGQVACAFTGDPQLIGQAVTGLRFTFFLFPIVGFQMATASFFQSIGKARISVVLSLSRQVLFLIPFLLALPLVFDLNGVWIAGPAADFTASLVTFWMLRTQFRKAGWRLLPATAGSPG
jgi:putative MATE family efflux protein